MHVLVGLSLLLAEVISGQAFSDLRADSRVELNLDKRTELKAI